MCHCGPRISTAAVGSSVTSTLYSSASSTRRMIWNFGSRGLYRNTTMPDLRISAMVKDSQNFNVIAL